MKFLKKLNGINDKNTYFFALRAADFPCSSRTVSLVSLLFGNAHFTDNCVDSAGDGDACVRLLDARNFNRELIYEK